MHSHHRRAATVRGTRRARAPGRLRRLRAGAGAAATHPRGSAGGPGAPRVGPRQAHGDGRGTPRRRAVRRRAGRRRGPPPPGALAGGSGCSRRCRPAPRWPRALRCWRARSWPAPDASRPRQRFATARSTRAVHPAAMPAWRRPRAASACASPACPPPGQSASTRSGCARAGGCPGPRGRCSQSTHRVPAASCSRRHRRGRRRAGDLRAARRLRPALQAPILEIRT